MHSTVRREVLRLRLGARAGAERMRGEDRRTDSSAKRGGIDRPVHSRPRARAQWKSTAQSSATYLWRYRRVSNDQGRRAFNQRIGTDTMPRFHIMFDRAHRSIRSIICAAWWTDQRLLSVGEVSGSVQRRVSVVDDGDLSKRAQSAPAFTSPTLVALLGVRQKHRR